MHSGVFERGERVAEFCFDYGQTARQSGFVEAAAAVVSDHHAPAHGLPRTVGIGVAESEAVGEQRKRDRIRVAGRLGGVDEAVRGAITSS